MKKSPRKQGGNEAPKKKPALSRIITTRWIPPLRELGAYASPGPRWPKGMAPLATEVAGVLEAAEATAYPTVPALAAERFNALAGEARVRFHAGEHRSGLFIQPVPEVAIGIHTDEGPHTGPSFWAFLLVYGFFMNPERDRLRRCEVCRRWFVDITKNRSARRCTRACTITWSNAHRPKKKSNKQRPKGGAR